MWSQASKRGVGDNRGIIRDENEFIREKDL